MRPHSPPLGLRERRKLRTQHDLLRSGLELFMARGYGHTTVGDIAHAVEVSERTFFRYFASKEELVLQPMREASAVFLAQVERHPAGVEPLDALCEAGRAVLGAMTGETVENYLLSLRLMCTEPDLLAAAMRLSTEEQGRLAEILRTREGIAPGDPRPALLAGVFHSAAMLATISWGQRCDGSPQALQASTDDHVRLLHSAVQGHWR